MNPRRTTLTVAAAAAVCAALAGCNLNADATPITSVTTTGTCNQQRDHPALVDHHVARRSRPGDQGPAGRRTRLAQV